MPGDARPAWQQSRLAPGTSLLSLLIRVNVQLENPAAIAAALRQNIVDEIQRRARTACAGVEVDCAIAHEEHGFCAVSGGVRKAKVRVRVTEISMHMGFKYTSDDVTKKQHQLQVLGRWVEQGPSQSRFFTGFFPDIVPELQRQDVVQLYNDAGRVQERRAQTYFILNHHGVRRLLVRGVLQEWATLEDCAREIIRQAATLCEQLPSVCDIYSAGLAPLVKIEHNYTLAFYKLLLELGMPPEALSKVVQLMPEGCSADWLIDFTPIITWQQQQQRPGWLAAEPDIPHWVPRRLTVQAKSVARLKADPKALRWTWLLDHYTRRSFGVAVGVHVSDADEPEVLVVAAHAVLPLEPQPRGRLREPNLLYLTSQARASIAAGAPMAGHAADGVRRKGAGSLGATTLNGHHMSGTAMDNVVWHRGGSSNPATALQLLLAIARIAVTQ
ncbi:hypothetical protein JKP88DRAFT_254880 [Tribonema minus]|uniref:Uncharacterized protein n=1 Tax=Tribonema minus TaxID=303371 RepID=A0A835ZAY6_9STRA|nr:hypothetical protein JKP88DRAFT_254880 [Tribonema minus]